MAPLRHSAAAVDSASAAKVAAVGSGAEFVGIVPSWPSGAAFQGAHFAGESPVVAAAAAAAATHVEGACPAPCLPGDAEGAVAAAGESRADAGCEQELELPFLLQEKLLLRIAL